MVRYGSAHNQDFAREHWAFFRRLEADLGPIDGKRVLDVGCGKMMWLTLLLRSRGCVVTGIDTEWVDPTPTPGKYLAIARARGLERAVRTLGWDALYARPYYRALAEHAGSALPFRDVDARAMSADALDFPDASFDLAVSHEVFEHLPRPAATIRELGRVLKPDGRAYVYTHNFTSLSGGHHIAWKYPDAEPSAVVPPWDHLRERRFPDIPSWINGWRMQRYRAAWQADFEILEWRPTEEEGRSLLTPELRSELAEYSEEELLTKGFIVVARPRAA